MPPEPAKRENLILNLACNLAIPTFVLMKLSTEDRLGPQWGMVVALIFPFGYGVYDLIQRKKTNLFSIIGIASVLLTGTMNQMKADGLWFAVKEAAIPTLFGVAVLISMRTKRPLVRELLWNDQVIDTARVDSVLEERGQRAELDQLLRRASFGLAASFLLSAILNFALARYLLKSPAGTPEFNAELGKMNGLSLPVIMLPTMVVTMVVFWKLMNGLTRLTGLELDEIFRGGGAKPKSTS
jgi:intracellular septation protein A